MPRTISDWKDVDAALKEMGALDIEIAIATAALSERLYRAFANEAQKILALTANRQTIENQVDQFCQGRKGEFAKKRSKTLSFGKVAFKVSERITFPKEMESVVISVLRQLGHEECVNVKETVDKTSVKNLPDLELAKCGITREKEDNFRIEPNISEIAQAVGKSCPASKLDLAKLAELIPAPGENPNSVEVA